MFEFNITAKDPSSEARCGIFNTPHGSFSTPVFMPCGTKGAVKTITPDELKAVGCEIILGNTFHLMLRPGGELISKMGGLHKWISWYRPMLTDSGGFQVFSLSKIRSINDDGAIFQSPIDGSTHALTPEKSIEIQEQLGADIIMAFDDCPPATADKTYVLESMERTHKWAKRCFEAKKRRDQALFPIVQGAIYPDLRRESAKFMTQLDAHGFAIGGVAVGEAKPAMWEAVNAAAPILPKEKPRYLMGVGEPADIVQAVGLGMDMFDCVLPTRLARHGSFWTNTGRKDIEKNACAALDEPLEKNCGCLACAHFSKIYLHHLMREKEILGHRLLTIHNLYFLIDLMRKIREEISKGTFQTFSKNFITAFNAKGTEK